MGLLPLDSVGLAAGTTYSGDGVISAYSPTTGRLAKERRRSTGKPQEDIMSKSMIQAMAAMAQVSENNTTPSIILGDTLVVRGLAFLEEKESKKGKGIVPACLYGIMEGGGLVRLQGETATLWYEGLKEAAIEAGLRDAVVEYEKRVVESRLLGATWAFDIEPAEVGKEIKLTVWDEGDAFDLHGGLLAGPVTITIRTHKPPKRAVYEQIRLGE